MSVLYRPYSFDKIERDPFDFEAPDPQQIGMMQNVEPVGSGFPSEDERLRSFGRALDALRKEIEAQLGTEDVAHIQGIARWSRRLEIAGRSLIHFSLEPVGFSLGVTALTAHKALELMEIGHMALHGCFDTLPEAEKFHAGVFHWKAPIDEKYWRRGHNVRHHQFTNVAGSDPDLNFALVRLSPHVPYRAMHIAQPISNLMSWFVFASAINIHVTGVLHRFGRAENDPVDYPETPEEQRTALRAFVSKILRYHAREYVFFPMLAGPFFLKTLLGNILSDVGRDLFAGAIIYCGHVGAEEFPRGTKPRSRAQWYKMQVEAAQNVSVSPLVSILTGGLDRQIEHHLFPAMPPNRLRQIAPRVKAICAQHGVHYKEKGWPETMRDVFRTLRGLAKPAAGAAQPV